MSIATIHVEQSTECHCCTSDKEVEICTLEKCNYPLCKEKSPNSFQIRDPNDIKINPKTGFQKSSD